jgi:hypothetical protein
VITDLGGVAVALVTIAGTLGATALTQYTATRGKSLDAKIQQSARAEKRREAADIERRAIYAELNNSVRDYRAHGHDYLISLLGGARTEDLDQLEKARKKYAGIYARAQMSLPDRVLIVARAVNDGLGHSYRAIHDIVEGSDRALECEKLHEWYDGPLLEAVDLLRAVLREDLGVTDDRPDIDHGLQSLREARLAMWPH